MLGNGFEHLTEIAEQVRAQHVAVVRDQHRHGVILPEVDVEMVVPEIGQHLDQLFAAVDRAQKGGFDQFVGGLAVPIPVGVIVHVVGIVDDVVGVQFVGGFVQGFESSRGVTRLELAVVDGIGIQLLGHVGAQTFVIAGAERVEGVDIPRPWTESHAVEGDDGQRCGGGWWLQWWQGGREWGGGIGRKGGGRGRTVRRTRGDQTGRGQSPRYFQEITTVEFLIHGSLLDFADYITAVGMASITKTDGVEQTSEVS